MSKSAYAKDGVDIKMGDNYSAFAAKVCRSTFTCSRFVQVKDFAEHNFRGRARCSVPIIRNAFLLAKIYARVILCLLCARMAFGVMA